MPNSAGMVALDMGASNGRVIWGKWTGHDHLEMDEIYRFDNVPAMESGLLCWNMPYLLGKISTGLQKVYEKNLPVNSIGLCSWGNTIGLLDEEGNLVHAPIHYREPSTESILEHLYSDFPRKRMYDLTLYIPMSIQPAPVLTYVKETYPELMRKTRTVMMISDLFNKLLTGRACTELTMAATSGMVDMRTLDWSKAYFDNIHLPVDLFPSIVPSQTVIGKLLPSVIDRENDLPAVIAVSGHDTASASGLIPQNKHEASLYLSCGTWSCMGCQVPEPIFSEKIYEYGATNDVGPFGDHQLRFNHTGLWILQECKRVWNAEGKRITDADIVELARRSEPFTAVIDTESEDFFHRDDMPEKIRKYCWKTGQRVPEDIGSIARVVLESLAFRYCYSALALESISGLKFNDIRIFGGGSRNELLCQMTADALNKVVITGPVEASVIGNFLQQGLVNRDLASVAEGQKIISASVSEKKYVPSDENMWKEKYKNALRVCNWKTY